jgi:hypothetical protein
MRKCTGGKAKKSRKPSQTSARAMKLEAAWAKGKEAPRAMSAILGGGGRRMATNVVISVSEPHESLEPLSPPLFCQRPDAVSFGISLILASDLFRRIFADRGRA